ncbi:Hypothetical protein EUBREC_2486 [Agathobacter rectalis ATCC 33656]|uniref:Uncharacterized protein n=1 Tax=Agathobacter rectalis (strain ATCC 33656 / DSM 3377 / JCM 17463 / KCTC 5835 / VPI 0990) TaxID=515619 RepID=C4ZG11_AGARV|nr:Hypothetical protein EUBREC_2486 [Agathobacter rectalis ATCC 33656]
MSFDKLIYISIHAPTRGATVLILNQLLLLIFQSTLPREERQKCRVWLNNQRNFNPRSHERSDIFG